MNRRNFLSLLGALTVTPIAGCSQRPDAHLPKEGPSGYVNGEGQMKLPLFRLLDSADNIAEPGELVWEGPNEKAPDTHQRRYKIAEGHVILTRWQGKLHEVIYQTPAKDDVASANRNTALFKHYGEGHSFNEVLDNGFGKTYRRADMRRYALWSYAMDYTTVGTMDYHEVKWG